MAARSLKKAIRTYRRGTFLGIAKLVRLGTSIRGLLDAGADLATVQKMVDHESVTTTAGYDRRGDAAKRKAADFVHVPFFPRQT